MEKIVVLVVDRSVHIIESWQVILSENAHIKATYGAVSFKDASRIFKSIHPDLVLLDGNLPGTMSFDLLQEMQACVEKIPVIILTNGDDNLLMEKCSSTESCLFFDKYYDFEKIPEKINSVFNIKPAGQDNNLQEEHMNLIPGLQEIL
jgi:DNA-binding response OmpR family regulator